MPDKSDILLRTEICCPGSPVSGIRTERVVYQPMSEESANERKKSCKMLLYGRNVFEETIANNSQLIEKIYIRQGYEDRYVDRISDKNLINLVQEDFFRKNLKGKKHQFVAVEFGSFPFKNHTYLKDHFEDHRPSG